MKTLLLQRICSSFASGRSQRREDAASAKCSRTRSDAQRVSRRPERPDRRRRQAICGRSSTSCHGPRPATRSSARSGTSSPSTARRAGRGWSTAASCSASTTTRCAGSARSLPKSLPGEPVGVYAGAGKSGIFRDGEFASVEREEIKKAVKKRGDSPARRHRRRLRGPEPPDPRHADQRGPALEPVAARAAPRPHQAIRSGAPHRGHAQSRLPRHAGREGLPRALAADEGPLRHLRRPARHDRGRLDRERGEARSR